MGNKLKNEFEDYSEALDLFKDFYLRRGYKKFLSEYASSYIGRGATDIVRDETYDKKIDYDENGKATWKIVGPKNIFGIELQHCVNHQNHNSITSTLILNSGRFDINRMMNVFHKIDVTSFSDKEILEQVETILSMTNEQVIDEFNITDNPNGILTNAILLDTVLAHLSKREGEKGFPSINCNAEDGSIQVGDSIVISNSMIQDGSNQLRYTVSRKFPNSKFEIDSIKGESELFEDISDKMNSLNNKKISKKLDEELLALALKNNQLKEKRRQAENLYGEYNRSLDRKDRDSME